MDELTNLPAALAVWMIAEDEISEKGLFPPRTCILAEAFIKEFQELRPKVYNNWDNYVFN